MPPDSPIRSAPGPTASLLSTLPLTDHHCHGVLPVAAGAADVALDRAALEANLNEAAAPGAGRSFEHSLLGLALRRWCPPVLDLDEHADLDTYLSRRAELGTAEVTRRLLGAAGIGTFIVDTGLGATGPVATGPGAAGPGATGPGATGPGATGPGATGLTDPDQLASLAGGGMSYEIVRLETLAESVVASGVGAAGFSAAVSAELEKRCANPAAAGGVVGAKTIAAYRTGLALPGPAPRGSEVRARAGRWLAQVERDGSPPRCADPVLSRFLIQTALERGLPVQVHCGYGDNDLQLNDADPVNLTPLLRDTESLGVPILLLHNYPFHRAAGYLAQVFSHVGTDLGLATHNVGSRATAVMAEALELVPFDAFLFSSDAFGLPELYLLGAVLFRRALGSFLDGGIADGEWPAADAERIALAIAGGNAARIYGLPATGAAT